MIMRWQNLRSGRGFTLVEAMMSMLVVSILLVGSMNAAGSAGMAQFKASERTTGRLLAAGLLNDILAMNYEDADTTPALGIESGESSASKSAWDDVDDFNGWTESPPQNYNGTAMSNMTGWQRSVTVTRIAAADLTQSASETGAKLITVTVRRNNVPIATRVGIRTNAP